MTAVPSGAATITARIASITIHITLIAARITPLAARITRLGICLTALPMPITRLGISLTLLAILLMEMPGGVWQKRTSVMLFPSGVSLMASRAWQAGRAVMRISVAAMEIVMQVA